MMTICRYHKELADEWNALVAESKNGTFLLNRNYMDYHADRFEDVSLMMYDNHHRLLAALPANYEADIRTVYSHHGLTYGGLIASRRITTIEVMEAMKMACRYYAELGAIKMYYRPIPYIYNKYPSQEELFFLYRSHAVLEARNLSQTIYIPDAIQMNELRRRCIKKSLNAHHTVSREYDVTEFWKMLDVNLRERHGVKPVHSIEELQLLMSRFEDVIRLYVVRNKAGQLIAGTIVYDMGQTVHTQYISTNAEGKATGAFDHLISYLLKKVYNDRLYFDFGVSTEKGGNWLNEGLTFQKESFGGRGVCYDTWSLNLSDFE
ncbi:MAG: GNAT family N-acetyltransferase [Bacteroidaceae bacterium]|nr:GNAT family N-acetyltransferase [Bacteroidaceae bacterium]